MIAQDRKKVKVHEILATWIDKMQLIIYYAQLKMCWSRQAGIDLVITFPLLNWIVKLNCLNLGAGNVEIFHFAISLLPVVGGGGIILLSIISLIVFIQKCITSLLLKMIKM